MMVHVLSGQWPFPGEAVRVNPRNPNNPNDLVGVTEFDRREEYINLIGNEHPLMTLIRQCLSNSPSHRPTSSEVHQRVSAVAADHPPSFTNRVEMMERIKTLSEEKERVRSEREIIGVEKYTVVRANERLSAQVGELQSSIDRYHKFHLIELDSLQAELSHFKTENQHLIRMTNIKDEEMEMVKKNKLSDTLVLEKICKTESESCERKHTAVEIQSLKQQIDNITGEKQTNQITTLEEEQSMINQHYLRAQLEAKTKELSIKDDSLASTSHALEKARQQLGLALEVAQIGTIPNLFTPGASLTFSKCTNLPSICGYGTTIAIGHDLYVGYGGLKHVFKYSINLDKWDSLPVPPAKHFELGHLSGKILTIGGRSQSGQVISDIYQLDETSQQWVRSTSIPPMPTACRALTAVSWMSPPALIVCGGRDEQDEPMTIVEIYTSSMAQWSTASPLPVPRSLMSLAVFHDTIFFIGGNEESSLGSSRKTVLYASVPQLMASCVSGQSPPKLWQFLPDVPHYRCSAAFLNGCLLAIGGQKEVLIGGPVYSSVYAYCPCSSSWLKVGDLPQARSRCTTATLPAGELLVMGGTSPDFLRTDTVYKISLSV